MPFLTLPKYTHIGAPLPPNLEKINMLSIVCIVRFSYLLVENCILTVIGHILTHEFDLNSGMASFRGGPQAAAATGSGATGIPVQQGSVRYTRPTELQGRTGIIVLLIYRLGLFPG